VTGDEKPIILVRDLSYAVGGETILSDISFEVYPREIFAVMGTSGVGKTTLLRLLMGLIRSGSGEITIDGESIIGLDEDGLNRVRAKMGMCFQYAALFDSLTVAGNVAFALRGDRSLTPTELSERVSHMLDVVDMEGTEERMPADLSGGMKKRVGIARALINQPRIMLYDEPTSGLDPVMARVISNLILQVRDDFGTTAVIVSHDVEHLFEIVDRALMLHEGQVTAIGTPAELQGSELPVLRQFIEGSVVGPITV
jgi:phospholipid/cholesterol/gamma-HCH transport system ATP-binding protein